MLRHSFPRRTVAAAALLAALLMPVAAMAAPPEAAEAGSSEATLNLWQLIRDLFGIADSTDAGRPEIDRNGLSAGTGSGPSNEGPAIDPEGLGEQPSESGNSEGDAGPHMDPNG
jgi:hypothetical protein